MVVQEIDGAVAVSAGRSVDVDLDNFIDYLRLIKNGPLIKDALNDEIPSENERNYIEFKELPDHQTHEVVADELEVQKHTLETEKQSEVKSVIEAVDNVVAEVESRFLKLNPNELAHLKHVKRCEIKQLKRQIKDRIQLLQSSSRTMTAEIPT